MSAISSSSSDIPLGYAYVPKRMIVGIGFRPEDLSLTLTDELIDRLTQAHDLRYLRTCNIDVEQVTPEKLKLFLSMMPLSYMIEIQFEGQGMDQKNYNFLSNYLQFNHSLQLLRISSPGLDVDMPEIATCVAALKTPSLLRFDLHLNPKVKKESSKELRALLKEKKDFLINLQHFEIGDISLARMRQQQSQAVYLALNPKSL